MAVETHLFAFGSWRKAKQAWINSSGGWVEAKEIWTKQAGTWRKVFSKQFVLTADIQGDTYNVYNAAMATGEWDGISPIVANLTVVGPLYSSFRSTYDWVTHKATYPQLYAGVLPQYTPEQGGGIDYSWTIPNYDPAKAPSSGVNYVKPWGNFFIQGPEQYALRYNAFGYGNAPLIYTPATPAFDTGALPAGSVVNLTVNAGQFICGAGGGGGYGGVFCFTTSTQFSTTQGFPGGAAIKTSVPINIVNNGGIWGGGGGGGGGWGSVWMGYGTRNNYYSSSADDPGGGGGGGAGYSPGFGGPSWRPQYSAQNGTTQLGGAPGVPYNVGSPEWIYCAAGGAGGNLGQPGAASPNTPSTGYTYMYGTAGGAAGSAVDGSSNVNWQVYGDVRGPLA